MRPEQGAPHIYSMMQPVYFDKYETAQCQRRQVMLCTSTTEKQFALQANRCRTSELFRAVVITIGSPWVCYETCWVKSELNCNMADFDCCQCFKLKVYFRDTNYICRFSQTIKIFVVDDDDSRLFAIESVRQRTEFLCQQRTQSASGLKAFYPSFFPPLAD